MAAKIRNYSLVLVARWLCSWSAQLRVRSADLKSVPVAACATRAAWAAARNESAQLTRMPFNRLLTSRYRLERRLGRGGMGTVYKATDTSLERAVAVKLIREDLVTSSDAAERFRREAKAAAAFAHPNLVTVHDFGVDSETRVFLVMELLEGFTLRQRFEQQKKFAPQQILQILGGVCAGLAGCARTRLNPSRSEAGEHFPDSKRRG